MTAFLEFPLQLSKQFAAPLDVDSKVETLTDLETIKKKKTTYEGMLTYCVESSTLYIFNKDGEFEPVGSGGSVKTIDIVNALAVETVDDTLDNYQYLLTDYTIHKMVNGVDTTVTNKVYVRMIEISQAQYEALPDTEKDKDYVWYVY